MKKGLLKTIQPIFFGPKRGQIKEDALNIYNRNFPHFKHSSFVPSLCSTKRNKSLPGAMMNLGKSETTFFNRMEIEQITIQSLDQINKTGD